ncbi:MAG: T9SS type A sorting domain-containing protein [Chitinophagales bacterium]|nr:T9SS type A sorting domain-containing protein [Chitinophagales bacterium]
MKKIVTLLVAVFMLQATGAFAQQRYLDEVFSDITIDSNVTYGRNITMFYKLLGAGNGREEDLKMDVYYPTTDTLAERPLIIYFHTGSFLPIVFPGTNTPVNQQATGTRKDSTVMEMCRQFAKRGYVAAAVSYRLGWTPTASATSDRTGTLLRAVYRAIQDGRTAVRWFRKDYATNSNSYGIDTSKIIVCGQGSGGYIAFGMATLDDQAETQISKFLDLTDPLNPKPLVYADSLGDVYGFGGTYDTINPNSGNIENWPGYSSDIDLMLQFGGALGDSSWLEDGDVPMVAAHVLTDEFAPYKNGIVIVPTTGQFVVDVMGPWNAVKKSNELGNNDVLLARTFNDPYTQVADSRNEGVRNIFPIDLPQGRGSYWEWWDVNAVPSSVATSTSNPNQSKTQALRYIDTLQSYFNPRIVVALGLPGEENFPVGIEEVKLAENVLNIYPNPTSDRVTVQVTKGNYEIKEISLMDLSGKILKSETANSLGSISIEKAGLANGVYVLNVRFANGEQANTRVIFQ